MQPPSGADEDAGALVSRGFERALELDRLLAPVRLVRGGAPARGAEDDAAELVHADDAQERVLGVELGVVVRRPARRGGVVVEHAERRGAPPGGGGGAARGERTPATRGERARGGAKGRRRAVPRRRGVGAGERDDDAAADAATTAPRW